jgi:hypothetical protein
MLGEAVRSFAATDEPKTGSDGALSLQALAALETGQRSATQSHPLFFPIVIIERTGANQPALRGRNKPLVAVRKMARLANGVVGHDVEDEIVGLLLVS